MSAPTNALSLAVRPISPDEHLAWIRAQAETSSVSFLQTPAWGQVKADWSHESLGWFDGEELVSAGLVLYRPIPRLKWSLAYLPEGPALATTTGAATQWVNALVDYLKGQKVFTIKMGPPVVARQWSATTIKAAMANGAKKLHDTDPDISNHSAAELVHELQALGWHQEPTSADGFGDVQPRFVFQLDLRNKSIDDLFEGMNQEWRRNIRKAEKSGVVVTEGTFADLADFHSVYVETAQRDGFTPRPLRYFERMWKAMEAEDPQRLRLFLAKREGQVLAATTLVTVGAHAWYSYGASTTAGRDYRPSNAVQWAMIQAAHASNCHTYDLRGIGDNLNPEHHLFGLIRFKLGTGGHASEYIGEFDLALRPILHRAVKAYLARR